MIATKTFVHVPDLAAELGYAARDPWIVDGVELAGVRTLLIVPMLKQNELIGAFIIYRQEIRPFTDKQIEILKNFATQAVIAIENARLLNELRQRTADLTEALEQQTATSQVLQVISSSPGDLQPVFEAMLQNAVGICNAGFGQIHRWNGDALMIVATHNTPSAFAELRNNFTAFFRPSAKNPPRARYSTPKRRFTSMIVRNWKRYAERDPHNRCQPLRLAALRSVSYCPDAEGGRVSGLFALARQEVRPFTEKQIELVQNFAAQAVIAIENARLLNELRQSLERQTATSQGLQVISSSTGDLEHFLQRC